MDRGVERRAWIVPVAVLGLAALAWAPAHADSFTDHLDFSAGNEPRLSVTLQGSVAESATLGVPVDGNASAKAWTIADPGGIEQTATFSDALHAHDGALLDGGGVLGSTKPADGWDLSYDASVTYGGTDPMTVTWNANVAVSAQALTLSGAGLGSYGAHAQADASFVFRTLGSGVIGQFNVPQLDLSTIPEPAQTLIRNATFMQVRLQENGIDRLWYDVVDDVNLLAPADPLPATIDVLGGAEYTLSLSYFMEVPYPIDPALAFSLPFRFDGVAVPEPGGAWLCAVALLALLGLRRRTAA